MESVGVTLVQIGLVALLAFVVEVLVELWPASRWSRRPPTSRAGG